MDIDKLKVVPQPLGAYADWLLDDDLKTHSNASQAEIAVLDIGMNTDDLYAIKGGRVEPRFVGGSKGACAGCSNGWRGRTGKSRSWIWPYARAA